MKYLYISALFIVIWTLFILSVEAFYDDAYAGIFIDFIAIGFLFKMMKKHYNYTTQDYYMNLNIIAVNIGLLPLIYVNILLTYILLNGKEINESGMAYVLVLIYSPVFYAISMLILMTYTFIKNYLGK